MKINLHHPQYIAHGLTLQHHGLYKILILDVEQFSESSDLIVSTHDVQKVSFFLSSSMHPRWDIPWIPQKCLLVLYIANCSRWKSFAVAELNFKLLENICNWMVVCMARPIPTAISLEKFCDTDRSMKTVKLLHFVRFTIYGIFQPRIHHKV